MISLADFYRPLVDIFTTEEIEQIDQAAIENGKDTHEGTDISEDTLNSISREFLLDCIYEWTGEECIEWFSNVLERKITPKEYVMLYDNVRTMIRTF